MDDTIARVVRALDPEQFNRAFLEWVNEVRGAQGQEQIALDGKTLRRSHDGEKHSALHSITAWGHECGLVLAQLKSAGKKNEQASVMAMLDLLQVKGAHITADAMNTQKKIAQKVHNKGGDYTLSLKDNHKTLRKEIQAYFHKVMRDAPATLAVHEAVDGGHGRIEKRTCRQLPVDEWGGQVAGLANGDRDGAGAAPAGAGCGDGDPVLYQFLARGRPAGGAGDTAALGGGEQGALSS